MATAYHPSKFALSNGQKEKLQKANCSRTPVSLKIKPEQIGHSDEPLLTTTQIDRIQKARNSVKGLLLNLTQTQIEKTATRGAACFQRCYV